MKHAISPLFTLIILFSFYNGFVHFIRDDNERLKTVKFLTKLVQKCFFSHFCHNRKAFFPDIACCTGIFFLKVDDLVFLIKEQVINCVHLDSSCFFNVFGVRKTGGITGNAGI